MKTHVYGASKLKHAKLWITLRTIWPEVEFTNRWPNVEGLVDDSAANARIFWLHDVADVQRADAVLVYSEPDEVLRGALVEAGVALGLGKRVICVGENSSYGTWRYHPMVTNVATLEDAYVDLIGHWRVRA